MKNYIHIVHWVKKLVGKNGEIPIIKLPPSPIPFVPPVLVPRNEDDFSLGAKAQELKSSPMWETMRLFCALQAEQEILAATDAPNHAAACCQRAKALLELPAAVDDAILRRESLIRAQEQQRAELNEALSEAAADTPPKPSHRWMARGSRSLA